MIEDLVPSLAESFYFMSRSHLPKKINFCQTEGQRLESNLGYVPDRLITRIRFYRNNGKRYRDSLLSSRPVGSRIRIGLGHQLISFQVQSDQFAFCSFF